MSFPCLCLPCFCHRCSREHPHVILLGGGGDTLPSELLGYTLPSEQLDSAPFHQTGTGFGGHLFDLRLFFFQFTSLSLPDLTHPAVAHEFTARTLAFLLPSLPPPPNNLSTRIAHTTKGSSFVKYSQVSLNCELGQCEAKIVFA